MSGEVGSDEWRGGERLATSHTYTHLLCFPHQLLEERRMEEESELQGLSEGERQERLEAIRGSLKNSPKTGRAAPVGGARGPGPAILDIPAELALILQALASEYRLFCGCYV